MAKRFIKITVFITIITAIVFSVYYVYRAKRSIYVKTIPVKYGAVTATVTATSSGVVESRNDIVISSQIPGRIKEFPVNEGGHVAKNEIIALLEQKEAMAQVRLAEANLAATKSQYEKTLADYEMVKALVQIDINEAKANFENAESELQRYTDLKGIIPQENIDEAGRNYEVTKARYEASLANRTRIKAKEQEIASARAAINQMEASLSVVKINYDYTKILAPFSGVISEILQEEGEFVSIGTPIARLIDTLNLYIEATIDEFDIGKVKLGQKVKVLIDAFPDKAFQGILTKILPVVSTAKRESRTSRVEIELNHGPETLMPGLSADVEIIVGKANNVLYLPTSIVMEKGEKRLVFVEEDGIVHKKEIKTGLTNWDYTEIKDGLVEGEQAITTLDNINLKDGSIVKVLDE